MKPDRADAVQFIFQRLAHEGPQPDFDVMSLLVPAAFGGTY
jgi:hypothetical protein